MDLSKWTIFGLLDAAFLATVKMAYVFGKEGNDALVVTQDDQVYVLGPNANVILGLEEIDASTAADCNLKKPRKVVELCDINVRGIAHSNPNILVVHTASGELYICGEKINLSIDRTKLMMVSSPPMLLRLTPRLLRLTASDEAVVAVACGADHSMVLTVDGQVYTWGQNRHGQLGYTTPDEYTPFHDCPRRKLGMSTKTIPTRVQEVIGTRKILSIACGDDFSMAIDDSHQVYGWGGNTCGQLGVGDEVIRTSPVRVMGLQEVLIVQVVCGCYHTLALSDNGVLYGWGYNGFGQLGTGDKKDVNLPQRIAANIEGVVEIAAAPFNDISAAITKTATVYMWGRCRGQSFLLPTETSLKSLHDVFACCASPAVTFKPIELDMSSTATPSPCTVPTNGFMDSLKLAFNDKATSDITFSIQGKLIHVHKAVLEIRCEHFRSMFRNEWEETKKDVIEINDPVYHAFLQYIYTDNVTLDSIDAIALMDLANSYLEPELKRQCGCILKRVVSVDNAATLYAAAIKYDCKELEDFCFRFICNHLTAVSQTPNFKELDPNNLSKLIVKAGQQRAFKN